MPSRRAFLHAASLASVSAVSGCATLRTPTTEVDITIRNFVAEDRTVSVVVNHSDEEVFRTERTLAAADPGGPAKSLEIPGAFEGADGEQFTVAVTPEGQPTDTYDYEITCADFETDDSFEVWILNPQTSKGGKRTHFTGAWCSEN